MLLFRILGIVFLVPGFATVFTAKEIVKRFKLSDRFGKIDYEHEMTEEEQEQYKFTRAVVNLKMLGMIMAIPGLIFILLGFK